MKYRNKFHEESSKRKMKKVEEWAKNPRPAAEVAKQHFEMHRKLAELYPPKNSESSPDQPL